MATWRAFVRVQMCNGWMLAQLPRTLVLGTVALRVCKERSNACGLFFQ